MARIRTVKPEFYADPDLGRLSLEARYLYQSMWVFSDDDGRIPGDPRLLKSQSFPFDDKVSVRKVKALVDELAAARKVHRYRVNEIDYLYLPNFRKHQVINKPQKAKHPPPPDGIGTENDGSDTGTRPHDYQPDSKGTDPTGYDNDRKGAADALAEHFREQGFHDDDIAVGLKRLEHRNQFGEAIKDPTRWLPPILDQLAAARKNTNGQGESEAVWLEGIPHVYVAGQGWVETQEAS